MNRVPLILAVFSAAACSEPLEFADWTIPVPEGTRIIEYAGVADEDRTERLEIERDLVLSGAFGRPLYQPSRVEVGPDGTVYVLDAGNFRVVAFDNEGHPSLFFGREGQGPGEFRRLHDIAVLESQVVIHDTTNSRLSVFRTDGVHVADHLLEPRLRTRAMKGFGSELVLIDSVGASPREGPAPWIAGRYSLEGTRLTGAVELESVATSYWTSGIWTGGVPLRPPWPIGEVARDGTIYATSGDEYQCLSADPNGKVHWALRVAYDAPALTEEEKREIVDFVSKQVRETIQDLTVSYSDFMWPATHAAIENLEVDGHGNLYVFPYAARTPETAFQADGPVPVDVYSPDGERLFSGMIAIENWDSALGDHVFRIETDPATEERVVARYRLVEPF